MKKTNYFQHPQAIVESKKIGRKTRIWAFVHILPGARIGEDCNICDYTFIENDVVIGNRVTIKCGVQLWDGITLEDDVFVGPNVTFTNDPFPRSKNHPKTFARTQIQHGASLGANATILPGITIGEKAMVGAGAVVTADVPPHAVVYGNPARWQAEAKDCEVKKKTLPNHQWVNLPLITDLRGNLSFGEYPRHIPFIPKRYFVISDIPNQNIIRGQHAHKKNHQFFVCLKGRCRTVLDNGVTHNEIELTDMARGLYVPPLIWVTLDQFSSETVLLVLASDTFSEQDYIRDYCQFTQILKNEDSFP